MTISKIYTKYKIMPNLQLHMLRVTAVAWQIADNMKIDVGTNHDLSLLIKACLLHDMGNIIKFKLDLFPQFLEPEGLDYWENVKKEFIEKYGNEEHTATYAIVDEISNDANVGNAYVRSLREIVKSIGFSQAPANLLHNDFTKKIADYADHRVSPQGVQSLEDRMQSGKSRFQKNKNITDPNNKKYLEDFERFSSAMRELEKQIFAKCKIKPEEITDESIKQYLEQLRDYSF